jgi:hypothetical protein
MRKRKMKRVSDAGGRFPRCEDLLRLIDGSEREGSGSGAPIIEKISSAAVDPGGKRIIQILSALIADFSVDDFVLVKSEQ